MPAAQAPSTPKTGPPRWVRALAALAIVLAAIGATIGLVLVRDWADERLEFDAPPVGGSYPFRGSGAGGMRVGVAVLPGAVSWRVNSAGTHNCWPDGHHALWNFTSGNLPLDRKGNFRVTWRISGHVEERVVTGRYWRRDRYHEDSKLGFECVRAGRWRASWD